MILSFGMALFVVIPAALLIFFGMAERSEKTMRERQLCGNSFCLRLPVGWDGRTERGGTAGRLVAAPFRLPSWVGEHKEGIIAIPEGRFLILVTNFDRGYLFGWPRAKSLAVSQTGLRAEPEWATGDRSFAKTAATFRGRSVGVLVQFADSKPSDDQFTSVNQVLATFRPAPLPVDTS
jgi:hypothetical protein